MCEILAMHIRRQGHQISQSDHAFYLAGFNSLQWKKLNLAQSMPVGSQLENHAKHPDA